MRLNGLKNFREDRCYIIAEIGGNFVNFDQAKRLIDEAKECGVDAVKLQTYQAKTISSKKAIFDMENTGVVSQFELFKKYEISEELHKQIFDYIESLDLDWMSTPSHESDVEMLERLNVPAHKVGSDDAVNIPYLKNVAKTNKPVILSTGMCTLEEVRESVSEILGCGNPNLALLHCVTSYPTHPEHVNLGAMLAMKKEFPNIAVGYSDHTIGPSACIYAAAMGADIVEKHFTYDKNAEGPDHMLSADPSEMKELVTRIREFEVMKGHGIKMPAKSEETTRVNNRKSLIINCDVKEGEKITKDMLAIKRPGYGIPPKFLEEIVGRTVAKNMEADDVLNWESLR